MKFVLILIMVLLPLGNVYCQVMTDLYFTKEGLGDVIQSSELIINDPLNQNNSLGNQSTKQKDLICFSALGVGSFVSTGQKLIVIPISHRINKVAFSVNLPYYFERTMKYEIGNKQQSGVGDITCSGGYDYERKSMQWKNKLQVKLPTGDAEAEDDGYLVPLGTGSFDFALNSSMYYHTKAMGLGLDLNYRISGKSKRLSEGSLGDTLLVKGDFDIWNGNTIMGTLVANWFINDRWDLSMIFNGTNVAHGSRDYQLDYYRNGILTHSEHFENVSNLQDLTRISVSPVVTFHFIRGGFLKATVLNLGINVPIVNIQNANKQKESFDDFNIYLSLNKMLLF